MNSKQKAKMNQKNKISKREKKFLVIESVFIFGILIYLFFSTAPKQLYPFNGAVIINPSIIFKIENADKVILSTTPEFADTIILQKNSDVILPPGKYYWKTKDSFGRESSVRTFVIKEHIGLNLRKGAENNLLENAGNVDLNISRKNPKEENALEIFDLKVNKIKRIPKDNSSYEGRQND